MEDGSLLSFFSSVSSDKYLVTKYDADILLS